MLAADAAAHVVPGREGLQSILPAAMPSAAVHRAGVQLHLASPAWLCSAPSPARTTLSSRSSWPQAPPQRALIGWGDACTPSISAARGRSGGVVYRVRLYPTSPPSSLARPGVEDWTPKERAKGAVPGAGLHGRFRLWAESRSAETPRPESWCESQADAAAPSLVQPGTDALKPRQELSASPRQPGQAAD